MYKVEKETLERAYKPFDVVSDENGSFGYIREVSVNSCQQGFDHQISYAVTWLAGPTTQVAWFKQSDLKVHSNLMFSIMKDITHNHSSNDRWVELLFNQGNYK